MTLVKFHPSQAHRFNRAYSTVLDDFFKRDFNAAVGADSNTFSPLVNVVEAEKHFRIELAAPGYQKENFNIDVTKNQLTISAEVKSEEKAESKEEGQEKYTRREFRRASFKRSFTLPESIDGENISAVFTDGILNIELPKRKEELKKNRAIEIK